jgi:hypothetical protein
MALRNSLIWTVGYAADFELVSGNNGRKSKPDIRTFVNWVYLMKSRGSLRTQERAIGEFP